MPKILHLFENLDHLVSQSLIPAVSWSATLHQNEHVFIALTTAAPDAISKAQQAGIEVIIAPAIGNINDLLEQADIVQIEYANTRVSMPCCEGPFPYAPHGLEPCLWHQNATHFAPIRLPDGRCMH